MKTFFSHPHFTYRYRLDQAARLATRLTWVPAEGRCSIAYQTSDKGVTFGVTFCSHLDNFRRVTGRGLATSHLKRQPVFLPLENASKLHHTEALAHIRNFIMEEPVPFQPRSIGKIERFYHPVWVDPDQEEADAAATGGQDGETEATQA